MKKVILLISLVLLVSALGCKQERWLRVYNAGEFEVSINVTGWEPNEDVVDLRAFYYPWQGEDSIDYNGYFDYWEWGPGQHRCWFVLNVNGKLVGVDPDIIPPSKIEHPNDIITLIGVAGSNIDILDSFPNLIWVSTSANTKTVDSLSAFPSNIRLYVSCTDITNSDLRELSRYTKIRALDIERSYWYGGSWPNGGGRNPTRFGFRILRNMKELRFLSVHGLFEDSNEIDRYLKNLPKLRETKVWIYDELQ